MLGLRFCVRAFSSCGKRGPLFIAVCRPLTMAASLVAEHRLQTRRLSSCGSRAQLLRGMWDLPRQGSNPCPLHWQADSQPLRHQGSPGADIFNRRLTLSALHCDLDGAICCTHVCDLLGLANPCLVLLSIEIQELMSKP